MSRTPKHKELKNTRLASTYGSWMYCEGCGKTIAYLCYVTYDLFKLEYQCKCGNHGSIDIAFENATAREAEQSLVTIKNRLCCPMDESPLVTIQAKKLDSYKCEVVCKNCNTRFRVEEHTL